MTEPSKADIDRLVFEKFPALQFVESMATAAAALYQGKPDAPDFSGRLTEMKAAREAFRALPRDELNELIAANHAREQARQRQLQKQKLAAEAAKRFFNQPAATARFAVWCKIGFWTPDEAAALLLGRDPHVVNPESLAHELSKPRGPFGLGGLPERTDFHCQFDGLRLILSRADGLSGGELKPAEVAAWAVQTQIVELPPGLRGLTRAAAIEAKPPELEEAKPAADGPVSNGQCMMKAALIRLYEREWRTIESDLRHAAENGLSAVAKGATRGMWNEQAALTWARQRGKLRTNGAQLNAPQQSWTGPGR